MEPVTKTKIESGKAREKNKKLYKHKIKFLLWAGIGVGTVLILLSYAEWFPKLEWLKLIVEHLGSILFAVVTIHFIYDQYIKEEQMQDIQDTFKSFKEEQLEDIQDKFKSFFEEYQKPYEKLKQSGIINIYSTFDEREFAAYLQHTEKTDIYILTIWITHLPFLKDVITDLLKNKKCKVNILIFDPDIQDVLKRRADSLWTAAGVSEKTIAEGIKSNRNLLRAIYAKLPDPFKSNLKCRYFSDWITCPIYCCDDKMLVGNYMVDKLAYESHFIEIAGKESILYKNYRNHFDKTWENSLKNPEYDILRGFEDERNNSKE